MWGRRELRWRLGRLGLVSAVQLSCADRFEAHDIGDPCVWAVIEDSILVYVDFGALSLEGEVELGCEISAGEQADELVLTSWVSGEASADDDALPYFASCSSEALADGTYYLHFKGQQFGFAAVPSSHDYSGTCPPSSLGIGD